MSTFADENTALNDCFRDKKDWRACKDEVSAAVESVEGRMHLPRLSDSKPSSVPDLRHQESDIDHLPPDGSVQAVLEAAGQRSEDGLEGCLRWRLLMALWRLHRFSPLNVQIYTNQHWCRSAANSIIVTKHIYGRNRPRPLHAVGGNRSTHGPQELPPCCSTSSA